MEAEQQELWCTVSRLAYQLTTASLYWCQTKREHLSDEEFQRTSTGHFCLVLVAKSR